MAIPTIHFKSVVFDGHVSLNFLCYYGDTCAINMALSNDKDHVLSLFEQHSQELLLNIGNLKNSLSLCKNDHAILSVLEALKQKDINRPRNMILALGSDENKDCIYISKDAIKNFNMRLQLLRIGEKQWN